MTKLNLTIYYNDQNVSLGSADIATMVRHTAEDDAKWPEHIDAQPYTAITLKQGAQTSAGVGTAYVSETPEQIAGMLVLEIV